MHAVIKAPSTVVQHSNANVSLSSPGEEEVEVLGTLGSLLTTVRLVPLGMLGLPPLAMGTVTVPGELLVTTVTWPAVFWKVACAPTPVRMAAVGTLLASVTNWTEEEVVAAQAYTQCLVHAHKLTTCPESIR